MVLICIEIISALTKVHQRQVSYMYDKVHMRSLHVLQFLRVTFDPDTGLLSSLSNLETKQSIKLTQNFFWSVLLKTINSQHCYTQTKSLAPVSHCWRSLPLLLLSRYNASDGNNTDSNQPSGAYIFRPNSSTPFIISKTAKTETIQVERESALSYYTHCIVALLGLIKKQWLIMVLFCLFFYIDFKSSNWHYSLMLYPSLSRPQ